MTSRSQRPPTSQSQSPFRSNRVGPYINQWAKEPIEGLLTKRTRRTRSAAGFAFHARLSICSGNKGGGKERWSFNQNHQDHSLANKKATGVSLHNQKPFLWLYFSIHLATFALISSDERAACQVPMYLKAALKTVWGIEVQMNGRIFEAETFIITKIWSMKNKSDSHQREIKEKIN